MSDDGIKDVFKTEAQALIVRLQLERGMKNADIAKALGRDRSLISQAARGVKPIKNALPALHALLGETPDGRPIATGAPSPVPPKAPSVPRRRSRQGIANVRGGLVFEKQGGAHVQTKEAGFLLKQLKEAAGKQQWVQIRTRFDKVTWKAEQQKERHANVNLYQKGYSADAILKRIDAHIAEAAKKGTTLSPESALQDILRGDAFSATQKKGKSAGLGEAGEVEQYDIEISDAPPWQ